MAGKIGRRSKSSSASRKRRSDAAKKAWRRRKLSQSRSRKRRSEAAKKAWRRRRRSQSRSKSTRRRGSTKSKSSTRRKIRKTQSKSRKNCSRGSLRNPKTHSCKTCTAFSNNELKQFLRLMGQPATGTRKEMCSSLLGMVNPSTFDYLHEDMRNQARRSLSAWKRSQDSDDNLFSGSVSEEDKKDEAGYFDWIFGSSKSEEEPSISLVDLSEEEDEFEPSDVSFEESFEDEFGVKLNPSKMSKDELRNFMRAKIAVKLAERTPSITTTQLPPVDRTPIITTTQLPPVKPAPGSVVNVWDWKYQPYVEQRALRLKNLKRLASEGDVDVLLLHRNHEDDILNKIRDGSLKIGSTYNAEEFAKKIGLEKLRMTDPAKGEAQVTWYGEVGKGKPSGLDVFIGEDNPFGIKTKGYWDPLKNGKLFKPDTKGFAKWPRGLTEIDIKDLPSETLIGIRGPILLARHLSEFPGVIVTTWGEEY